MYPGASSAVYLSLVFGSKTETDMQMRGRDSYIYPPAHIMCIFINPNIQQMHGFCIAKFSAFP